jgi:hypothetical protein
MINTSSPSLIFLHYLREKSENLPMLQIQNLTDISDKNIYSMVMSPDQPNLGFQLKLIRSAPRITLPNRCGSLCRSSQFVTTVERIMLNSFLVLLLR